LRWFVKPFSDLLADFHHIHTIPSFNQDTSNDSDSSTHSNDRDYNRTDEYDEEGTSPFVSTQAHM
jgi:hypothetical protein